MKIHYFVDFDSTIIAGEILEILAEVSLSGRNDKDIICKEIESITQQGMLGTISFSESLTKRLSLMKAKEKDILACRKLVKKIISPSFLNFCNHVKNHEQDITIVSGGFKEIITPVLSDIVPFNTIYANTFIYSNNTIIGSDQNNPLSHSQGKVKIIQSLQKSGKKIMIGDGFTDYETKLYGAVDEFWYYAEHVQRYTIMEKADRVLKNFDEVFLPYKKC